MIELRKAPGQVSDGLGERTAKPRIAGCLVVGGGRVIEPVGLLLVRGDQLPVRLTCADQGVGHLGVQCSPDGWRCQLGGDLAQQLMPKPPAIGSPWLQHQRLFELVNDIADLVPR